MGTLRRQKKRAPRCMGALSHKCRRAAPRVDGEPVAKRKTSATLHESVCFSKKRTPRCMGTLVGATVNRQPGSTGPDHPKGNPRRRQKVKKGECRILENKAPERPTAKTKLQVMERTAMDISENKARERQRCNTIKTTEAPYIGRTNTRACGPPKWRRTI